MNTRRPTREIGRKFHADGTPRRFPGNTIVCMMSPEDPAYRAACAVQDFLRAMPAADAYVFLPPDSFHMTVMDLVCDAIRDPDRWSHLLALDTPLPDVDRFFHQTLEHVPAPDALRMQATGLAQWPGIVITLQPADEASATALSNYRAAVAEASGVRLPNHDSYTFHITLSYLLGELEADESASVQQALADGEELLRQQFGIFETGRPTFSLFDDMFRFVPWDERHTLDNRALMES